MKLRWTRPALDDLEAIGHYIRRNNSAAIASRVVARIFDSADMLIKFPDSGRAGRIHGTRELVVTDTPFIAPYRVQENYVEILAVFHSSRQWPEKF